MLTVATLWFGLLGYPAAAASRGSRDFLQDVDRQDWVVRTETSSAEVTRRSLAEAAPESVPTSSAGPSVSAGLSNGGPGSYQVPSFVPIPYTHLWVSSDGNTHIAECKLQNLLLSSYIGGQGGLQAQSYRESLPSPSSELIIQLAANQYNPPHTAPSSQFVSVLSGRWYAQTSDGFNKTFTRGDLLFQDNTPASPAANTPNGAKHISGALDNHFCNMIGTQVTFAPTVDHPCPF